MITDYKITEIFCATDEFSKKFDEEIENMPLLTSDGKARRRRSASMSDSEIMTILIMFHFGTFDNFKHYYLHFIRTHLRSDFHALKFTCRDQFRVMSYAQFTDRSSLRDIEATLTAFSAKLYHSGLKFIPKSTLAYMNETKDWQIYCDFAMVLITWAQRLYKDDYFRLGLDEMVFAFDSSTIELCLKLCPWAEYREESGAMKMHTLLNLRGSIPTFIWMTEGKVNDMNGLDVLPVEAGAYYLVDKGYVDFWRL